MVTKGSDLAYTISSPFSAVAPTTICGKREGQAKSLPKTLILERKGLMGLMGWTLLLGQQTFSLRWRKVGKGIKYVFAWPVDLVSYNTAYLDLTFVSWISLTVNEYLHLFSCSKRTLGS